MAVNEERNSESVDDESNRTTNEPTPGPSNASQTSRRRKNPPELIEAGKTMNKALNTLNAVLNQRSVSTSAQQEDECELYGRMLAKKLRKFPEHERVQVMYELDGTIIRLLASNTPPRYVSIPSPSPRSSYSEPIVSKNMARLHSSHTSYSEPIPERYFFDNIPLSTTELPYIQQPSQHLPQQEQSQQHILPQQQPSQYLPQPQQQPSLYLPQQQQQQSDTTTNTNMQNPVLIHLPDHLSPNPSLENTQDNQNSITVLSDLLILPQSAVNADKNKRI